MKIIVSLLAGIAAAAAILAASSALVLGKYDTADSLFAHTIDVAVRDGAAVPATGTTAPPDFPVMRARAA